jgi:hypothetical protein
MATDEEARYDDIIARYAAASRANAEEVDRLTQTYKLLGKDGLDLKKKLAEITGGVEKARKRFTKSVDDIAKDIDELSEEFTNGRVTAEDLRDELKSLRNQVNNTANAAEKAVLIQKKAALEEVAARDALNESLKHTSGLMVGAVISEVVKGLRSVATAALSGGDALDIGSKAMVAQLDVLNGAYQAGASGLTKFGTEMAAAGGKVGLMGVAAVAVGTAISFLSNQVSALAKEGIQFMVKQTRDFIRDFNAVNQTGASFAGGLKEMTETALLSGLTLEQFSKVISGNKDILVKTGLGVGEGSKKMASAMNMASKLIGVSGNSLSDEMLKLGFSFEEQAAMTAQVMALTKAAGYQRALSDKEVAERTAIYAKDLKLLADITGEDAKKAAEKAKQESMKADIMAGLTPEQAEKFQKVFAATPDALKTALLQKISGGVVSEVGANVAFAQSKGLEKAFNESVATIKDGNVKLEDVNKKTLIGYSKAGEEISAEARAGAGMSHLSRAQTMGANIGQAGKALEIQQQVSQRGLTSADSIEKSDAAAKAAAAKPKEVGDIVDIQIKNQKQAIDMQKLATDNLQHFGKAVMESYEAVKKATDAFAKFAVGGGSSLGNLFSKEFAITLAGAIATPLLTMVGMKMMLGKGATAMPGLPGGGIGKGMEGIGAGADKLGNGIGKTAGTGKVADGIGKGMESVGKGMQGIGEGVGKGISGVLSGLADGLRKLSDPKLLIGTGVLIGLGGALFVAGKGLQEFADVSWEDAVTGVGVIAGLGVVAAGLSFAGPMMIVGAASIGVLAGAMWVAGKAFQEFSKVEWTKLSNGMKLFGAGLSDFVKNGGPAILGLPFIAAGITALGIGMLPLALGITAINASGPKGLIGLSSGLQMISDLSIIRLGAVSGAMVALAGSFLPLSAGLALISADKFKGITTGLKDFASLDPEKLIKVADAMQKVNVSLPSTSQLAVMASTALLDKFTSKKPEEKETATAKPQTQTQLKDQETANVTSIDSTKSNQALLTEVKKMTELLIKQNTLAEEAMNLRRQLVDVSESHKRTSDRIFNATA